MSDTPNGPRLGEISTHWSGVHDAGQFAMRYATAVRAYLVRLLSDPNDADEVAQEFFLQVTRHGFARASADRGRFRNYLIVAIKNAARKHMRREDRMQALPDEVPDSMPDSFDAAALAEWRRCIIDRAMRQLFHHERQTPGNLFHTVLKVRGEMPDADSKDQAARASVLAGRPVSPVAYRKQVSRALRAFAWLVVCEVADTVEPRTAALVEEELRESGLFALIEEFLPYDWRDRPFVPNV